MRKSRSLVSVSEQLSNLHPLMWEIRIQYHMPARLSPRAACGYLCAMLSFCGLRKNCSRTTRGEGGGGRNERLEKYSSKYDPPRLPRDGRSENTPNSPPVPRQQIRPVRAKSWKMLTEARHNFEPNLTKHSQELACFEFGGKGASGAPGEFRARLGVMSVRLSSSPRGGAQKSCAAPRERARPPELVSARLVRRP